MAGLQDANTSVAGDDVVESEVVGEPDSSALAVWEERLTAVRALTRRPGGPGMLPDVLRGSGDTVVHGGVQITYSGGTVHEQDQDSGRREAPGQAGEPAPPSSGLFYLLNNQKMFRNLIAGLLVLALILVAIIAVLQPSPLGAAAALSVLALLGTLVAAVLGVPWVERLGPLVLKRKRRRKP